MNSRFVTRCGSRTAGVFLAPIHSSCAALTSTPMSVPTPFFPPLHHAAVPAAPLLTTTPAHTRSYYTNADRIKKDDPYATLNLTWGATATEIKDAYRQLARQLHPDVSNEEPAKALKKFRRVKEAYDRLMNVKNTAVQGGTDVWEEWSFAIWRNGDLIAQDRTDVAGAARKRPAKPATAMRNANWGVAALGHPDGRGNATRRRGEYLEQGGEGGGSGSRSSTVGTGRSKWVTPKEFRPWNPDDVKVKSAREFFSGGSSASAIRTGVGSKDDESDGK